MGRTHARGRELLGHAQGAARASQALRQGQGAQQPAQDEVRRDHRCRDRHEPRGAAPRPDPRRHHRAQPLRRRLLRHLAGRAHRHALGHG